jgi:REP element-mobilizing transposase RayT
MTRYRIVQEHALYFVTFGIVQWLPVLTSRESCQIVSESFDFCHQHKHLRVNAYVIMPTHLHAILFDADFDTGRLQRTLADLRKYTGRQLVDYCAKHMPACFTTTLRASAGRDRLHRFWQSGIHPEAIYTEFFWRQKLDYLHDNPCRKGLVREPHHWRYSSAAHWLEGQKCDIRLTPIEW